MCPSHRKRPQKSTIFWVSRRLYVEQGDIKLIFTVVRSAGGGPNPDDRVFRREFTLYDSQSATGMRIYIHIGLVLNVMISDDKSINGSTS